MDGGSLSASASFKLQNSGKSISELVEILGRNNIFPSLDGQRLMDLLYDGVDLVGFIRSHSILDSEEDMHRLLDSKLKSVSPETKGDALSEVYSAIFENNISPEMAVTIFSGGTGSNNLTKGLIEAGLSPTLLVNAYDDGKSTGDIRKNFEMLGPSDIAKNIIALIEGKEELKAFLKYRLPVSDALEGVRSDFEMVCSGSGGKSVLSELLSKLEEGIRREMVIFLNSFNDAIKKIESRSGKMYDLRDYGLRNIVYTGAHLFYGGDYHQTNQKLLEIFGANGRILLNNQEHLWLIGITEKGKLLNSEAEVVSDHADEEIVYTCLVRQVLNEQEIRSFYSLNSIKEKIAYLESNFKVSVSATEEALDAIQRAEVIVFAPTTFHSSLAPTLYTEGISEELRKSSKPKVLVANLIRERGYRTLGENLDDFEKYLNLEVPRSEHTKIDYLIINSHGNRTDGVVNENRIPIDKRHILHHGVEPIKILAEDRQDQKKHQHRLVTSIIQSLEAVDRLGFCIHNGMLREKRTYNLKEKKREQLKELLRSPFLYPDKKKRIKCLVEDILEINSLEEFRPLRPVKVVILGAGRGARMKSDLPKILYPINGKANLSYLLEKYSALDKIPVVVVNEDALSGMRGWAEKNDSYDAKVVVTSDLRGTAMSLLDIFNNELSGFSGDIFLSWGDITNTSMETIMLSTAIHQALPETVLTMPTAWVKNPSTNLVRDEEGNVVDFLTPDDPVEVKESLGERDASVFIFSAERLMPVLKNLADTSGIYTGNIKSLNFLKVIGKLSEIGECVIAVGGTDPRECAGFNTPEMAGIVEKYMGEIRSGKPYEGGIEEIDQDEERNLAEEHSRRFELYIKQPYRAALFDVDETLTDGDGEFPEDIVEAMVKLLSQGVPTGIITGRTINSLSKKILEKISSHPDFQESSKQYLFVYPENGAYGYRWDKGLGDVFYSEKMPYYLIDAAMRLLRKKVLEVRDDYFITDYKIHLFIKNATLQKQYLKKANLLFGKLNLPLVAYGSNSMEKSGAILISRKGIHKGVALKHFGEATSVSVNEIVKICDLADRGYLDNALLKGRGSFSVNEFDPEDPDQAAIILAKGLQYKGIEGTRWLLENLKFRR